MGAADLIRIDSDRLLELEQDVRKTIKRGRHLVVEIPSSPKVGDSLERFTDRWERHRNDMFDALEKIAEAAKAIRETFEQADQDMAAKLNESASDH